MIDYTQQEEHHKIKKPVIKNYEAEHKPIHDAQVKLATDKLDAQRKTKLMSETAADVADDFAGIFSTDRNAGIEPSLNAAAKGMAGGFRLGASQQRQKQLEEAAQIIRPLQEISERANETKIEEQQIQDKQWDFLNYANAEDIRLKKLATQIAAGSSEKSQEEVYAELKQSVLYPNYSKKLKEIFDVNITFLDESAVGKKLYYKNDDTGVTAHVSLDEAEYQNNPLYQKFKLETEKNITQKANIAHHQQKLDYDNDPQHQGKISAAREEGKDVSRNYSKYYTSYTTAKQLYTGFSRMGELAQGNVDWIFGKEARTIGQWLTHAPDGSINFKEEAARTAMGEYKTGVIKEIVKLHNDNLYHKIQNQKAGHVTKHLVEIDDKGLPLPWNMTKDSYFNTLNHMLSGSHEDMTHFYGMAKKGEKLSKDNNVIDASQNNTGNSFSINGTNIEMDKNGNAIFSLPNGMRKKVANKDIAFYISALKDKEVSNEQ